MKAALVVGGTGALGRAAIDAFSGAGFRTVCVDFAASEQASRSVRIPQGHWGEQLKFIEGELAQGEHPE
jgi:NAD(P)-dependent dehydrogenase (short-subunit alcohol dehydrogenase family)